MNVFLNNTRCIKRFVATHLFTIGALLFFSFVGLRVGQIRQLLDEVYASGGPVFWFTAVFLLWAIVLVSRFLVVSPEETTVDRLLGQIPRRLRSTIGYPLNFFLAVSTQGLYWLARLGRKLSGTKTASLISLTVAMVSLTFAIFCPLSPAWFPFQSFWPLPGGFLRMLGFLSTLVSLWLWMGTQVGANQVLDDEPHSDKMTELRARVWRRTGEVLSILILLTFILEIVWISVEWSSGLRMTVYTVWAFVSLALAGTLSAGLVDFLDRSTRFPWRLLGLVVLLVLTSRPSHVDLGPSDVPDVVKPLQATSSEPWVEAALARLNQEPQGPAVIVTASGGGSRAALVAALSMEIIHREFDQNGEHPACIWMGSGVSGGAIALAADQYPAVWQTSTRDAVTRDYLGPIFRGFLTPFANRGESLTAYWDRTFPWKDIDQTIADPSKPLLVLGVADIDTGRRVMVGYPNLPDEWFERWTIEKRGDVERMVLSDKVHKPYSLSVLRSDGSRPNLRLTRGVRMSSSFPFGFEPSRLTTEVPEPNDDPTDQIHFLDGGMVDNTGVDSVLAILAAIDKAKSERTQQLATELRRRGIFLIEIDAGAKSGEVAKSGPLSRLTQPFGGFTRGVHASARRARDQNIEDLKDRFGPDFVTEPIESYPASDEVSAIVTTLALTKHDIARLIKSFTEPKYLSDIRDALQERYDELEGRPANNL